MELNPIFERNKIVLSGLEVSEIKREKLIIGVAYCLVGFKNYPASLDSWMRKDLLVLHIQNKYKNIFEKHSSLTPKKIKSRTSDPDLLNNTNRMPFSNLSNSKKAPFPPQNIISQKGTALCLGNGTSGLTPVLNRFEPLYTLGKRSLQDWQLLSSYYPNLKFVKFDNSINPKSPNNRLE